MTTSSSATFPFGKYSGKTVAAVAAKDPAYLQWFATTDIPERYPDLDLQIQAALRGGTEDTGIPAISEVEVVEAILPVLEGRVRDGRTTNGVNQVNRLHLGASDWHREPMPSTFDDHGGSGSIRWDVPNDDGVYEIHSTEGSITRHAIATTYWLRQAGCWSRIHGGRPAVIAVLRSLAESESS